VSPQETSIVGLRISLICTSHRTQIKTVRSTLHSPPCQALAFNNILPDTDFRSHCRFWIGLPLLPEVVPLILALRGIPHTKEVAADDGDRPADILTHRGIFLGGRSRERRKITYSSKFSNTLRRPRPRSKGGPRHGASLRCAKTSFILAREVAKQLSLLPST